MSDYDSHGEQTYPVPAGRRAFHYLRTTRASSRYGPASVIIQGLLLTARNNHSNYNIYIDEPDSTKGSLQTTLSCSDRSCGKMFESESEPIIGRGGFASNVDQGITDPRELQVFKSIITSCVLSVRCWLMPNRFVLYVFMLVIIFTIFCLTRSLITPNNKLEKFCFQQNIKPSCPL